jgi:hypothetical protein
MSNKTDKQRFFDWIYRTKHTGSVINFYDFLILGAKLALGKSQIDAEAFAQSNEKIYWNWFLRDLEEISKKGLEPLFTINDKIARRISWFPNNINLIQRNKDKHKAIKLTSRPFILSAIDSLNDREYEALSCVICKLLNADKVKLTPKGNEGGIDFFASIIMPPRSHVFFGYKVPMRIIGQCKKYSKSVQVESVDRFINTINEVKFKTPSLHEIVPNWFWNSKGPIVGWLISHKGFQSGAENKAKDHGIIVSDSLDLTEIISLSRIISSTPSSDYRIEFIKQRILEELSAP